MKGVRILAINPGSTSTKVAVYKDYDPVFVKTIRHQPKDLEGFQRITDQFSFRKDIILRELEEAAIDLKKIRVVMGRGGLLRPIESGVYEVNEKMKNDLMNSPLGEHASNLGGLIADDLAKSLPDARAYITDPIVVDELHDLARVSGHPVFQRISIFHALNQKAVARNYAGTLKQKYEDLNLIVVHLGGGITIGAHRKGRVIDVNQGLDGEGPLTPERSGTLPTGDLVKLCYSGQYTLPEVKKMVKGEGGMLAHLGTNDCVEVEKRMMAGDEKARLIFEAMAYQVAKWIGSMATVLKGEVQAILITGGIAHSRVFTGLITERVQWIAPVQVYPGEDEMWALAMSGLRILTGETIPKNY
ncbi:MAG TPA: butyrate kinase [Bacteroidales bacterium]|nr:butyrate kinase [Bacteroidales bacterium]HSA42158.1 butyrate kinase [Bacteroidales bacterium]